MQNSLTIFLATVTGLAFGLGFGYVQERAARANERRQAAGKLKSGWSVMPGSFTRVAYLLVGLALVQAFCPKLFAGSVQWCVSAGLAIGFGMMQYRQLMRRHRASGL